MMRFHALVTHLYNEIGHKYIYHQCFRSAIQDLGLAYKGYVNKKTEISTLPVDWETCLMWKEGNKIVQFFRRTLCFSRIFRRNLQQEEKRIFFLESLCLMDFVALTLSLCLFAKKEDRFWLLLRYDLKPQKEKFYLPFFRLLQKKMGRRLVLLSDSEKVGNYFQELLDQPIHIVPIPHTEKGISSSSSNNRNVLWWPGRPDLEKGADKIQALASLKGNVEICLSEDSKEWIKNTPGHFKFIKPVLSREEYLEQFGKSDGILLPYDPVAYSARTSGIFVEAVFAGKLPFVVEGSWLAHELHKHALAELILDWERPDLLDHITSLLKDQKLQDKFKKMQQAYLAYHSLPSYTKELQRILASES